ncbi:MAG: DUF3352 domain-containing protein [Planctomycetes bacterium]|nr:DUF3352 domain-containing protein [Planctomycetota bacterium]
MSRPKFLPLAPFALLATTLAAQTSVLPYLPKNTLVAVSAPDLASSIAEFQKTPLAKMWHEEEMQTFLADALEFAQERFGEGLEQAKEAHANGQFPIDPEQLLKLRVGGITGAVTSLELGMGNRGPVPNVGLVVHIDFGDSAETWNGLIQMGLGMLEAKAGNKLAKTESTIGGVKVISMAPSGRGVPEELKMGLNVAMVPNGILIGTLADDVKSILENMKAQTPALGADPRFTEVTERVQAPGAEIQTYVHVDPMVEFALSALTLATEMEPKLAMVDMDGVERAALALGLRDLGSMAAAGKYVDGKTVTHTYHAAGKSHQTTAAAKTIDMSFLKWVPKDAVTFSAWNWDVGSIYDRLVAGLEAYDPEFARNALEHVAQVEQQLGFNIRDDLFGSFGDHGISWSMAVSTIMSMPESATLVAVKSEEKVVKVLRSLAQLSDGMVELEEGERRGIQVYSLRVNWEPPQGMGMGMNPFDMFTPTFAFKDGYLVLGFSVGDIKRVFKRMEREDDPKGDIRSNKEFAAIAGSIPANIESLSYTDWKTQFESFYQLATSMLALVPMGEDVPIDMSLLPDSGTMTQHLFPSVSYTTSDGNGSETVITSPWGPELALVFAALVGGGAAAWVQVSGR